MCTSIIYLYRKINKFFLYTSAISDEFIVTILWLLVWVAIYGGLIIPFVPIDTYIRMVVTNVFASCSLYGAALISTWWVVWMYERELKKNNEVRNIDKKQHISLENILKNADSFDFFANHLVKEFCIENGACVF